MTNPYILHTNKVESATTITVTSEATGFEKEKAYDHRTSTSWKADAAGTVYFTVDMGSPVAVDSWACYGQDLFNNSGEIKLQYSSDNFSVNIQDFDDINYLTYSEQFDHANWITAQSISANAINSPIGDLTSDKLIEDTNPGNHTISQTLSNKPAGNINLSIYVKAGERTHIQVQLEGITEGVLAKTIFDISSGTIVSTTSGTAISPEDVGDGWYRISVNGVSTVEQAFTAVFFLHNGTQTSYTGDGSSGLYLWGAQFQLSSNIGEYKKTESVSSTGVIPVDSKPIMKTGPSESARYWRWEISSTGSASNIGILWFGEYLITNTGLAIGPEPLYAAQRFHPVDSVTQDGEFVGRTTKEKPLKGVLRFVPFQSEAYIRGDYTTMLRAIEQHPFFVIPDPSDYPAEVCYCWTDKTIPKPRYTLTDRIGADIPIFAKVS